MSNTEKAVYEIALGMIKGIGDILAKNLLAYIGSAEEVFAQKESTLQKIPGIGTLLAKTIAKSIRDPKFIESAEKELLFINKHRIKPLFYTHPDYPKRLKECNDSPLILYQLGECNLNSAKIINIVGTRNATHYGKELTQKLIQSIAANYPETIIVSGLAYGIDIEAHRMALQNNLETVAVLGHGLDRVYPALHTATAKKIITQGCLLTEFPSATNPDAPNFVRRNRIVAGMSEATIVIESGIKGGALITATIANSYNRDVFAYPGNVGSQYSAGCNKLIKTNQASMIEQFEDLEYLLGWQRKADMKTNNAVQQQLVFDLDGIELSIIKTLQEHGDTSINDLATLLNSSISTIATELFNLEMKGFVQPRPGNMFTIKRR